LPSGNRQLRRTDKSSLRGEVLPFVACASGFVLVTHRVHDGARSFAAPFSKAVSSGLATARAPASEWVLGSGEQRRARSRVRHPRVRQPQGFVDSGRSWRHAGFHASRRGSRCRLDLRWASARSGMTERYSRADRAESPRTAGPVRRGDVSVSKAP
jgi:hypothetical protein